MSVDLHNTENCPRGHRCESCGRESDDLAVCTVRMDRLGIACLMLCSRCADSGVTPPVTLGTAVRLVLQHCIHLGITGDEADAILREQVEDLGAWRDEIDRKED